MDGWIARNLQKPLGFLPQFRGSPDGRELLDLLGLIRDTSTEPDPQASASFVLSMTPAGERVLGLYLPPKIAAVQRRDQP